jgi:hypothetical protein
VSRAVVLSAFLGLAVGYSVFSAVYPNMAYPPATEASLGNILVLVFVTSIPVGFLTSDFRDGVLEVFLSIPFGVLTASALSVSPVYSSGIVGAQADVLVYDVIRNGFFIYVLALILDMIGGSVGLALRERFLVRAYSLSPRIR